jgi:hypothetical protein
MQYLLRARLTPKVRGKTTLYVRDLDDVQISYTDDLREVAGFGDREIDQLIQQLYEDENKVRCMGISIPGGEFLIYSDPMRKLIALGAKARSRLQDCLADHRIQNEVALILGIIGDERTVPLLIECYPGLDDRRVGESPGTLEEAAAMLLTTQKWARENHDRGSYLIHALRDLTGQWISTFRGCSMPAPGSGLEWKKWWTGDRKLSRALQPNPNSPIRVKNIEAARRFFVGEKD